MLTAAGYEPGHGRRFRWREICQAWGADPASERAKEARARTQLLEFDLREKEKTLVPMSEVETMLGAILLPIKQRFDCLASECCALANPCDPVHARIELERWADTAKAIVTRHLPQVIRDHPEDM